MLPTITGMYGIMAHHRNMITAIIPGMMRYQLPGQPEQMAAVSAGLVKVENGEVLILVDSAERPEEIDLNRARREADAAKEAMLQKRSIPGVPHGPVHPGPGRRPDEGKAPPRRVPEINTAEKKAAANAAAFCCASFILPR